MNKATTFVAVVAVLGLLASVGLVAAFGGVDEAFATTDQKTTMQQAIANNDYEAWKAALVATLTQENFDKLVVRHQAMAERQELHNALQQAIADKDYQAYTDAMQTLKDAQPVLTEDEFNTLADNIANGVVPMGPGMMGHHMGFGGHHMGW